MDLHKYSGSSARICCENVHEDGLEITIFPMVKAHMKTTVNITLRSLFWSYLILIGFLFLFSSTFTIFKL